MIDSLQTGVKWENTGEQTITTEDGANIPQAYGMDATRAL